MKRRSFLGSCAALSGAATLGGLAEAWAEASPKRYARTRLVDVHGRPLRARDLAVETNYVFHYPFASTPCFLLRLRRPVTAPARLKREDGATYAWDGGVGADRSVVAFSAICAHKLAYPTRDVSFIRYQKERSPTSSGAVIHCCADHSVYDPSQGARVVSGPAPQPLAAVLLEWDAQRDQLHAVGTRGGEKFGEFFEKYAFKLEMELGRRAREAAGATCITRPASAYSRQWQSCPA